MGWNVPDDWGSYYYNCSLCGSRCHASEGGCGCTEEKELCHGQNCGDSSSLDSYHDYEEVTKLGDGKNYCPDCLICECCDSNESVTYNEEHGLLLCPQCVDEDHWCPAQGPLLDHVAKTVSD